MAFTDGILHAHMMSLQERTIIVHVYPLVYSTTTSYPGPN
jgi:hypothetical protein